MLRKSMMAFLVFASVATGLIWLFSYLIVGENYEKYDMRGFGISRVIGGYDCHFCTTDRVGGVYMLVVETPISDAESVPLAGAGFGGFYVGRSLQLRGPKKIRCDSRHFAVPLWFPFLLFAVYPAFVVTRFRRRRRKGWCTRCGYNLTALTTPRCPECSTEFDPSTIPQSPD